MKKWIRHDKRKILERIDFHLGIGTPRRNVCARVAREFDLTYERIRRLWRETQLNVVDDRSLG